MPKKSRGYYFDSKSEKFVIDKVIGNQRIRYTTQYGKGEAEHVERELVNYSDKLHRAKMYGERIPRLFREASVRYIISNPDQSQIDWVEKTLRRLDLVIGDVFIHELHSDHPYILGFIRKKKDERRKTKTINSYLEIIRRVLNSAENWRDDTTGLTWLERAPKIELLPEKDGRKPKPLSWNQQDKLLEQLPDHQRDLALFYINSGLRSQAGLALQWSWEKSIPGLGTGFLIPKEFTKHKKWDHFLPLNSIAAAVINRQYGKHDEFVFSYKNKPIKQANTSAFQKARKRAGIDVRIHDYRHTFGHRLRTAGVDAETRAMLLGHATGSITTHYSQLSIQMLFEAVEKITVSSDASPVFISLEDLQPLVRE